MMSALNFEVVDEVCKQFAHEGVSLKIRDVDGEARRVELDLELDDVECADCVLPADYLERLISSKLWARSDAPVVVVLNDVRRTGAEHAEAAPVAAANRSRITVLDPTATGRGGNPDPGPDLESLDGKSVLFRVDAFWRSWDWTVDEWTKALVAAGARVRTWKRWQGIPGDQGREFQAEYEGIIGESDLVVSGLANCGSCSAWTIRDAISGLKLGVPTIAVVTEHFVPLAKMLAEDGYRPGLRLFNLPYPFDTRPEEEVRRIAREMYPKMLELVGVKA